MDCKTGASRQMRMLRDLMAEVEQTKKSVNRLFDKEGDVIDVTPVKND